jgi:L-2-hydroxyglutarate oxidase LhgO
MGEVNPSVRHYDLIVVGGGYYKPGSLKAKNCVEGRRELVAFCKEHGVAHDICGKIIVATDDSEIPALDRIFENGKANGVEAIERIGPSEIRQIEPNCTGLQGVWVPCTGIVDFAAVAEKLGELLRSRYKAEVLTGCGMWNAERAGGEVRVTTGHGKFEAKHLISCAGLQSDRVARLSGAKTDTRIVAFRGDYFELSAAAAHKVRNLIYPVPDPRFPFLGVHFTRMIHGGVECGPNAVFCFKREGYGKADFNLADSLDALCFPGVWKFFSRHWRQGWEEYRRAFSKKLFLESLRKLVPDLRLEDLRPHRAGVRAVALGPDGRLIDDFKIINDDGMIHVLNAPSPAATACLAIGGEIERMACEQFGY